MTTMMYEFVLYIIPIVLAMYNEFHLKNGFSTINFYDNSLPTRKILPFTPPTQISTAPIPPSQ